MDVVVIFFFIEYFVSWIIFLVFFFFCGYVFWIVNEINYEVEGVVKVEDVEGNVVEGFVLFMGYYMYEKEKVFMDEKVGGNFINVMSVYKE